MFNQGLASSSQLSFVKNKLLVPKQHIQLKTKLETAKALFGFHGFISFGVGLNVSSKKVSWQFRLITQKSRIARTGKELGDGDFKKLQLKSFNLYKLVEFMKIENEINVQQFQSQNTEEFNSNSLSKYGANCSTIETIAKNFHQAKTEHIQPMLVSAHSVILRSSPTDSETLVSKPTNPSEGTQLHYHFPNPSEPRNSQPYTWEMYIYIHEHPACPYHITN